MTALTAAHSLLPATPLPALGPEWLDPAYIINSFVSWVGPWAVLGVALVVFAETGLLVGFFLPGAPVPASIMPHRRRNASPMPGIHRLRGEWPRNS